MKRLYARLVLWLIRPALELSEEQNRNQFIPWNPGITYRNEACRDRIAAAMRSAKDAAIAEIRRSALRGRPVDPR